MPGAHGVGDDAPASGACAPTGADSQRAAPSSENVPGWHGAHDVCARSPRVLVPAGHGAHCAASLAPAAAPNVPGGQSTHPV